MSWDHWFVFKGSYSQRSSGTLRRKWADCKMKRHVSVMWSINNTRPFLLWSPLCLTFLYESHTWSWMIHGLCCSDAAHYSGWSFDMKRSELRLARRFSQTQQGKDVFGWQTQLVFFRCMTRSWFSLVSNTGIQPWLAKQSRYSPENIWD